MPADNSGFINPAQAVYSDNLIRNILVHRRKHKRMINTGTRVIPGTSFRSATIAVYSPCYQVIEDWELSYEVTPQTPESEVPPNPPPLTDPSLVLVESLMDPVQTILSDNADHMRIRLSGKYIYHVRFDNLIS